MSWKTRFSCTASAFAILLGGSAAVAQTTPDPQSTDQTAAPGSQPADETTAAGSQRPAAPPAGTVPAEAPATAPAEEGEIVVTGLRRSLQSAQAIKRNSEGIVDAIVAEDIGKLPDLTASAALARVPGVQVNRAAGEAAQVQVRGLPDISTTYNGREIFTADGRFVQIQDFPAGSVGALEVYKSSTANLIEGGIGGQVNVRSRRPFDFDGFEAFGAVNGVHTYQAQKIDWNGNFLISNRWDTGIGEIGILVNAAYTKLRHLDSTREESVVIGPDFDRASEIPFRYPDATALYYGAGDRERPSATAAIQWKPTPELEIYADGLFQGFRSHDTNRFFFSPLFGTPTFTNVVLEDDGVRAQSLTATGAVRPEGFTGAVRGKTDTYQAAAGAIYTADGLRVSADIAYTDSTYTQKAANIDFAAASSPVRDVSFDVPRGVGGPSFSYRDFDVTNPANFIYRGLFEENLRVDGDDIQARADVEWETKLPLVTRLQFGVRYDDRTAARRRGSRYQPGEDRRIPLASLPVELELVPPGFRYDDIQQFRTFVQPTGASIRGNIDALRAIAGFPEGPPPFDPVEAFDAGEKGYTGYAQLKYEFDVGIPVQGLIGLRAVKTKTTVAGTSRDLTGDVVNLVPVSRSNEYTDYLPNVSARLELRNNLQLRLAYTETRTKPGYFDLNPSGSVSPPGGICLPNPNIPDSGPDNPQCRRDFNGGNPDLRPLMSNNYDASLEWYFSRTGSLTGAVFRRDVNGFISRVTIETDDPIFGRLRSNLPQNGGNGRIQGIELAFAAFLDFASLPDWAQGFGLQANYTYIDGKSELAPELATTLPGQQRVPGVSKHAYNLVALYERPKFSARVAYNYRSNWVDFYSRVFDPTSDPALADRNGPTLPQMHGGLGIVDFATTITPIENITIAFDISNVLGATQKFYRAYNVAGDTFPVRRIYLERLYSLGVRFRF